MALGIFPEMDDFKIAKTLVEGRFVAEGVGAVGASHEMIGAMPHDVRDAYRVVRAGGEKDTPAAVSEIAGLVRFKEPADLVLVEATYNHRARRL